MAVRRPKADRRVVFVLAAIAGALAILLIGKHVQKQTEPSGSGSGSDSDSDWDPAQAMPRRRQFRRRAPIRGRRVIGTGPSKCFSCEAQDVAVYGDTRNYGSKCLSCERQDRAMYGRARNYGSKCFGCENTPAIRRGLKNF